MQPELPSFTYVADLFPSPAGEPTLCACPQPRPRPRAERKGAARTYCARCGRPVQLALGDPER